MSKFTKGRWMYLDAIEQVCSYTDGEIWPTDITGELCLNGNMEEMHANGRLIAAAPEMYELVNSLASLPDEQCMIGPLITKARRIIARIDGPEATNG